MKDLKTGTIQSLNKMAAEFLEYERGEIEWSSVLEDWEPAELVFMLNKAVKIIEESKS